jgi:hypothetical protein
MEHLLDTAAGAHWLSDHGVRRSAATLRKQRCVGGGPRFRRLNKKPYYTEPDLTDWIESQRSEPAENNAGADRWERWNR